MAKITKQYLDFNGLNLYNEYVFSKIKQADLSVNDPSDPRYVHGRTHWIGDPELVTIIKEATPEANGYMSTLKTKFVAGQVYTVNCNGIEYECTAWNGDDGYVYLGNGNIYGGAGKGENVPFCFETGYVHVSESGTYIFSITTVEGKYHPIDEKFLPPVIGRPGTVVWAEVFNNYSDNVASGAYSHAEGSYTIAMNSYAHAEGLETIAIGKASHAEGCGSQSTIFLTGDINSTSYTIDDAYPLRLKIGDLIIAEGILSNVVSCDSSTGTITVDRTLNVDKAFYRQEVIWCNSFASGDYSHAEGYKTIASGDYSHAEGYKTIASDRYSHAEGRDTIASDRYSHAEGNDTIASRDGSHAEGYKTIASGDYSHAEGQGTIANCETQHVQGDYNIKDTNSSYAHIVGNGTSDTARSNAHTIDWNGLGWFAGGLKVGGTGQDDTNAVEVATLANAEEWVFTLEDGSTVTKKVVLG